MRFAYRILLNLIICMVFALMRTHTDFISQAADNELSGDGASKALNSLCDTCPNDSSVDGDCLKCNFNYSCVYGSTVNTTCQCPNGFVKNVEHRCMFCYQLPPDQYNCTTPYPCQFRAPTRSSCIVKSGFVCMGQRKFLKNIPCEFVSGYKWSTALMLSVTLGGFGIDRFYLGNWEQGIGKLFSFGGLGIWTVIDVILIATGYLKPSDGSLYLY